MEIAKWSLFKESLPAFEVYSSADLGFTIFGVRAAIDLVALEVYVWEPSFSNVMFVSISVINWNRLLLVVQFANYPTNPLNSPPIKNLPSNCAKNIFHTLSSIFMCGCL
jgi:hypothetical protein